MKPINEAKVEFLSRSANEGFARAAAACFAAQMDPTLEELGDIKTVVSEGVTNAIVHAYPDKLGKVMLRMRIYPNNLLEIVIRDWGVGILDVDRAREPMYTTGGAERSGMGYGLLKSPFPDGKGDDPDPPSEDLPPTAQNRRMISEQKDLLAAAKEGDREACQEIIHTNDRLIWSIVQRYTGRGVELDDLFQLGCIGFLKAIQGFDPDYGTCFSTYAVPKIAGEIRRFLRDDGAVKVSRSIKEQAGKLYAARERLRVQLGRDATVGELAQETGLEIETIASIDTATAQVASLQAETAEGLTLESALGDSGMEENLVEQIALRDAIASLPQRERMVIVLRYYRGFTQERTARVIGVSQVQVSRIERKAVQHLREKLL